MMNRFRVNASRLFDLFSRRRRDHDLHDEVEAHLDLLTEEYVRRGMARREARAAARREFGGVDQVKETYRDQRGLPFAEAFAQDLRYAIRTCLKSPGFAAVIVLTLAVGIGSSTAIFSVVNAVMLRPLPVPNPDQLFLVALQSPTPVPQRVSYPMFEHFRSVTPQSVAKPALAAMTPMADMQAVVDGRRDSERVRVQLVSGEYFSMLEVSPFIGRLFTVADNQTVDAHPIAVVSHRFWQQRLGGLPGVLGQSMTINRVRVTIVGVAPIGFSGLWLEKPADFWMPLMMQHDVRYGQNVSSSGNVDRDQPWATQNGIRWVQVVGRSKPEARAAIGAALDIEFQRDLAAIADAASRDARGRSLIEDQQGWARFLNQRVTIEPLSIGFSNQRGRLITPLLALLAMVSVILLITCANTANLLLARASARRREMAIRLSMGASRGRLIRQLLTESAVLVVLAASLGILFAYWAGATLAAQLVTDGAGAAVAAVPLDTRVLGFAALTAVITIVLFGLAPACRATRVDVGPMLRTGTRTMRGGARLTMPKLLVAAQVALSLLLVVGAGLFYRSLRELTHIDLGFQPEHVVSLSINPRSFRLEQLPALYRRLVDRVETIPGVHSAALAECQIAAGCHASGNVQLVGYVPSAGEDVHIERNLVGARYFSTLGMRMSAGREFDAHDTDGAPAVAIVNQTMAHRYFAAGPVVGQRINYGGKPAEIIGVVEDARVGFARQAPVPMAYLPLAQQSFWVYSLDVRTAGDPRRFVDQLRRAIEEAEPGVPIDRAYPLAEQVSRNLSQDRLVAGLTGLFGGLALGLASFGLFGVMSYNVARRTAELGVRLALGATRARVLWIVLRESLILVLVGLSVGIPAVFAATRFISGMLFGVAANDPATIVSATAVLAGAATLAGVVPALNASRVDPIVALRQE
jgi:predicted permease